MGSHAKECEDRYCVFSTELRWFALRWGSQGVRRVTIGHRTARAAEQIVLKGECASVDDSPYDLADRLIDFAAGGRNSFHDVSLDHPHMTDFQRRVLESCREIPYGETLSYAQLAVLAGSPRAARAVGNVMAHNRFPILIPCHRVVGSHDSLGGFSAPNGLTLKQRMLANEAGRVVV